MSARLKSILIIILTLLIGFAGGFITQKELHRQRVKKMRERVSRSGGHSEFLKRILDVTEEQETQISPILETYGPKMQQRYREFRLQNRILTDSLAQELTPYLRDDQIQKLKNHFSRKRRDSKRRNPNRTQNN